MITLTPNSTPDARSIALQILQLVTDPVAAKARLDELEALLDKANKVVAAADSVKAEQAAANRQIADREAAANDQLNRLLRREHDVAEREAVVVAREPEIARRWSMLQAAFGDELK